MRTGPAVIPAVPTVPTTKRPPLQCYYAFSYKGNDYGKKFLIDLTDDDQPYCSYIIVRGRRRSNGRRGFECEDDGAPASCIDENVSERAHV